nr:hypothetical protein [Corynebacterium lactis]
MTSENQSAQVQQARDLGAEERKAAGELELGAAAIPMMVAAIGLVVSFFLPHSGVVLGFDVLLDTEVARKYFTTTPERIYSVLVVLGVLLTVATLITRTTAVAFVTWALSCVQAVYSVFSGWMRQSRPQELAGEGIAWGLAVSIVCSFLLAITMSVIAFRRTRRQHEIASERRAHADSDPVLRAQQAYLRSGMTPHTTTDVDVVDDRRQRAKQRHRQG